MHQYLPAIGFSKITKTELENLINEIKLRPDYQESAIDFEGNQFVELRYMVADNIGIVLRGIYNDDDEFVLDYYYPELEYCKWYSRKELNVKIKNNPKWADMYVGTDTFDSLWNAQKMYRFVNGNLRGKVYKEGEISEEDKKLMTESTMSEKVVTLAYKQYEKTYMPFDELWKTSVPQEDIDENANAFGGAWRHIHNKKNVLQKDDAYQFEKNDFEKVVTLGYHRTQVDDAIECPVCRDLYDIMRSGYEMVPWYKRLIVPYYRWKYRDK